MSIIGRVFEVIGAWCAVSLTAGAVWALTGRHLKRPAPGEGSPRPAAATPPRGPQVPGSPWPPAHDHGGIIEHAESETRECGCRLTLDHLRKRRHVHHCGRTDFDVTEWERRLTL